MISFCLNILFNILLSILLSYEFIDNYKIVKFKEKRKWFPCQKYFLPLCNEQVEAILTRKNFATETREFCGESWGQSWVYYVTVKVKVIVWLGTKSNLLVLKKKKKKKKKKTKKKKKIFISVWENYFNCPFLFWRFFPSVVASKNRPFFYLNMYSVTKNLQSPCIHLQYPWGKKGEINNKTEYT